VNISESQAMKTRLEVLEAQVAELIRRLALLEAKKTLELSKQRVA
jgi:hypothetical protein